MGSEYKKNLTQQDNKQEQRGVQEEALQQSQGIMEAYYNPSADYIKDEKAQKDDKASKWEGQEKKEKRAARLARMKQEEEKKREFFRPMNEMSDNIIEEMDQVLERKKAGEKVTSMELAEAYEWTGSAMRDFDPEFVLKKDAPVSEEFQALRGLFMQMNQYAAQSFQQTDAMKMLLEYQTVSGQIALLRQNQEQNRVLEAAASRYLFATTEEGAPEEPVALVDPQVCYVLLMNTVTVALKNCVNYMGEDNVNIGEFAKLCGMAEATTIASSYMLLHTDFIKNRETYIEERTDEIALYKIQEKQRREELEKQKSEEEKERILQEEKMKEEQKKARDAEALARMIAIQQENQRKLRVTKERLPVIAAVVNQIAKEQIWPKETLYLLSKEMVGEVITTKEEKEFLSKINLLREKLQDGLGRVRNFLNTNEDLYLSMGLLKDSLYAEVIKQMGSSLFEEYSLEKENSLLDAMKQHADVKKWTARKAAFYEGLKANKVEFAESELDQLWSSEEIQNLILTTESEDLYQKNVDELTGQAGENNALIIKLVNQNFFSVNRARAIKQVRKYMGGSWVTGSPNVIQSEVMNYIADMNLLDAKLHHREEMLKNIVKEYGFEGFEEATAIAVRDNVSSELFNINEMEYGEEERLEKEKQIQNEWKKLDTEEVKNKLGDIKGRKLANATYFKESTENRTYEKADWDKVELWYKANIFMPSESFKKALIDLLNPMTEKNEGKEKELLLSPDAYRTLLEKESQAPANYKGKLLGADFMTAEEFGELFSGRQEVMLAALNKILSDSEWKGRQMQTMPFLQKVDSAESLENLTYIEYRILLQTLQQNMRRCLEEWKAVQGTYAEEIRNELLADILMGDVNKENIERKIKEADDRRVEERTQSTLHFYAMLEVGKDVVLENKFRQIKTRDESEGKIDWGMTEKSSASRIKRFSEAKNIWDDIYAAGLGAKMLLICNSFLTEIEGEWEKQEKKEDEDQLRVFFESKVYDFVKQLVSGGEGGVLSGLSETERETLKGIFEGVDAVTDSREFLMCGAENMVFQKEEAEVLFSEQSENSSRYRRRMAEMAMIAAKRSKDMAEWLGSLPGVRNYKPSWLQRLCELRIGLQEIEGSLEEQEKSKAENKETYGIESWEKVCEEIQFLLLNSMGEIPVENRAEMEQREGGMVRFHYRKEQLKNHAGGVFQPILPYLIVQPEVLQLLTGGDEVGFAGYLEKLEQSNVGKIAKMIVDNIPADLQGMFVLQYQEEILSGVEAEETVWTARIDDCVYRYASDFYEANRSELRDAITVKYYYPQTPEERREFIARIVKTAPELRIAGMGRETIVQFIIMKSNSYKSNLEYAKERFKTIFNEREDRLVYVKELVGEMLSMSPVDFKKEFEKTYYPHVQEVVGEQEKKGILLDMIGADADRLILKIKEGEQQADEIRGQLKQARNSAWQNGSPLIASFDLKGKKIEKDHYDAAKKYIEDRKAEYPPALLRCLMERHIVAQIEGETMSNAVINAYVDEYNNIRKTAPELDETQIREYIVFFRYFKNEWVEGVGTYEEKGIREYNYRKATLEEFGSITCTDPLVQAEFQEFMESMSMGKYTMGVEEFRRITENRKQYFINMNVAFTMFDSFLKEHQVPEEHEQKYKEILRAYFVNEIIAGVLEKDELVKMAAQWLMNEECRQILFDKIDAERNGDNDVIRDESSISSFLESKAGAGLVKKYGELTEDQKKIFALALMIPGKIGVNDMLPNADLLNADEKQEEALEETLKEQVQNFIERKEFRPQIHYAKVLERLQTPDGKVDTENFELAMSFVELCSNQREENIPRDWERIGNGTASIEAAERIQGIRAEKKRSKMPERVDGRESFREMLQRFFEEEEETGQTAALKKRMEALFRENKEHILIVALQNRSMLDYTTGTSFIDRVNGKVHEFANEELYQQSKEFWSSRSKEEEKRMMEKANTGAFCTRAIQMLFSYQLKDNVDLSNRELTKEDFAKGALKRDSAIDWSLLERALDFVDETETEHLRIQAAHNAKNYVQYSTNEAAKEESEKWKKVFKEEKEKAEKEAYSKEEALKGTRSKFEAFLLDNGSKKNKEVAALLSGYFCLSDAEKELFAKALQSRDVLDVSKKNLWMNQFGLADRDYVNVRGRDALMNEYVTATLSRDGRINMSEEIYGDAVQSLLSTQIDDSIDFAQYKEQSAENFMAKEHFYQKDRNTAIDWKLFRRALQFVHRCSNERQIFEQDRELFLAGKQGDSEAEFQFDNKFLRRNIHRSGNRVSRFIGKRLLANVIDRFPVKYQRFALLLMPVKAANYLNGIEALQKDEKIEDILKEMADDVKGTVKSVAKDVVKELKGKKEEPEQKQDEQKSTEQKQENKQEDGKNEEKKEEKKSEEKGNESKGGKTEKKADSEKLRKVERADFSEDPRYEETNDVQMNVLLEVNRRINGLEDDKEELKHVVETVQNFSDFMDQAGEKGKGILDKGVISSAVEYGFSKIYDNDKVISGITLVTSHVEGKLKDVAVSKVKDYVGKEAVGEFSQQLSNVGEKYKELKESLDDNLESVQEALDVVQNVIEFGRTLTSQAINQQHLRVSSEKADEARAEDDKLVEERKAVLTDKQKQLLDKGREENVKAGKIASDVRSAHITTEMVQTVSDFIRTEVAGNLLEGDVKKYVDIAMTEVTELVVFLRGVFIDKDMLQQYYGDGNEELKQLRTALMKADSERYKTEETFGTLSNLEVIRLAKGFESETELASFVGMNLIQAILFSASEDNPVVEAKIRAKAVLLALGMKDAIGKRDSGTALEVFNKLMKEEYR